MAGKICLSMVVPARFVVKVEMLNIFLNCKIVVNCRGERALLLVPIVEPLVVLDGTILRNSCDGRGRTSSVGYAPLSVVKSPTITPNLYHISFDLDIIIIR